MSAAGRSDVQPLAHFLAGLEIGDSLRRDVYRLAGPWVASLAGIAAARREGAEATQFDAAAILELRDDGVEDGADHALDFLEREVRMVLAQLLDEF